MSEISAFANVAEVSFIDNMTLEKVKNEMFADFTSKYKEITGEVPELAGSVICCKNGASGYDAD